MNRKIVQLGKRTNLTTEEVKKLTKIGISGLLALILSLVTGGWNGSDAAEVTPLPRNGAAGPLPEKCGMVPKVSDCKGLFTTYYYDAGTTTCREAMGCVSSVFDSKEECVAACIEGQVEGPSYPVSKYGAVGIRDFRNAE
jgi:hypothetical protein